MHGNLAPGLGAGLLPVQPEIPSWAAASCVLRLPRMPAFGSRRLHLYPYPPRGAGRVCVRERERGLQVRE